MKIEGPSLKHKKNKLTHGQMLKGLIGVVNPKGLTHRAIMDIQMPKKKKPYKARPNARKPHTMKERNIERQIIKFLRANGCKVGKINPEMGGWNNGIADILCYAPSGQWWIEVKTEKGRLQKNQIEFREMCRATRTNYMVARSVNDVKRILDANACT